MTALRISEQPQWVFAFVRQQVLSDRYQNGSAKWRRPSTPDGRQIQFASGDAAMLTARWIIAWVCFALRLEGVFTSMMILVE